MCCCSWSSLESLFTVGGVCCVGGGVCNVCGVCSVADVRIVSVVCVYVYWWCVCRGVGVCGICVGVCGGGVRVCSGGRCGVGGVCSIGGVSVCSVSGVCVQWWGVCGGICVWW